MRYWLLVTAVLAACGAEPGAAKSSAAGGHAPAQSGPPTARPEQRAFRDWIASCDNGASCVAFGGPVEGYDGWVRISMAAGPEWTPVVHVGLWGETGPENAAAPLRLQVDGASFVMSPDPHMEDDRIGVATRNDALTIIRALADARLVGVIKGSETVSLSASGAAAALLWIDERQGRVNTVTALRRRGERPASAVPAAPALPVVTPAAAADQTGMSPGNSGGPAATLSAAFRNLPAIKECRDNLSWNPDLFKAISRDRLNADTELWGVPCDAGAYNLMMRYWITGPNGADPRAIALQGVEGDPQYVLTNPEYDPAGRTLRQFVKGRGIGDCGTFQKWTWTGHEFVLTGESSMGECWGVPFDLWPTLWRTR